MKRHKEYPGKEHEPKTKMPRRLANPKILAIIPTKNAEDAPDANCRSNDIARIVQIAQTKQTT